VQRNDEGPLPELKEELQSVHSKEGGADMSSTVGFDVLAFLASFILLAAILFGAV
jgi:hypothetical protein